MTQTLPSPDGSLAFEFGDEEYRLVFDWTAIAFFEKAADYAILDALRDMERAAVAGRSPKSSHLAFLIQAGLQTHHGLVPIEQAARMAGHPLVIAALAGGVRTAMPRGEGKPGPGKAKARAKGGTGTSSNARRSKRA